MSINWTEDQEKVIHLRNSNILVSAAAGSGKTAVLVERIIGLLKNQDTLWNIDEILIVTFTKAAAAEMKGRILKRIQEEAAANPGDQHMQQQLTLIHQAQITTIDGFCSQVLKENFYLAHMEPGFRILEEGEAALLRDDALQQTLTEAYQEHNNNFLLFIDNYATGKTDVLIEEAILKLYQYGMSHPWPEKWLDSCESDEGVQDIFQQAVKIGKEQIEGFCKKLEMVKQLAEQGGPDPYCDFLQKEISLMEGINTTDDFQEMRMNLLSFSFGRLPSAKKDSCNEIQKKTIQSQRNAVKDSYRKLIEKFFYEDQEMMQREMDEMSPMKQVLVNLTKEFMAHYKAKKQERNVVDFSDLEHNAIQVLVDEKTQMPTDAASGYQEKYRGIMIDEYQDSNLLQEYILNSISRNWLGEPNVFMVGDVKQSIYRFRQAEPKLFLKKYETYTKESSPNQKIDLHQNFRSRQEIVTTVNQVFGGLMTREVGGIEYDEDAVLHLGAQYPESVEQRRFSKTQVFLADDGLEEGGTKKEIEIRQIIQIVKEQMTGVITDKLTGKLREVRYSDIVVLLRSPGSWGDQLLHEMLEQGIPTRAVSRTGYFASEEVQTLLNYLRLIDNSMQDIPLVTSLTGILGGVTNNELAQIRLIDSKAPFYKCMERYLTEGNNPELREKLISFDQNLKMFQQLSKVLPIHQLIQEIYHQTLFYDCIAAMPAGNIRRENLDMMVEKAITFENTSYHGVFQFVRYMDQLKRYEIDYGNGKGQGGEEAVQIMSIHKSKGLEYPIVILGGCGRAMNKKDFSQKMILHPQYGITLDYLNGNTRIRKTTLEKEVAIRELQKEQLGEEIRVLYVALTRAKEKLILSGTIGKVEEKIERWSHQTGLRGKMLVEDMLTAGNYFSLMMPMLVNQLCCHIQINLETATSQVDEIINQTERILDLEEELKNTQPEQLEKINQRFLFQYPYLESEGLKLKMSVSEIKHKFMEKAYLEEEEKPQSLFENKEEVHAVPLFLREKEENQGALRGTAVHRFLECVDFSNLDLFLTEEGIEKQMRKMVEDGKLAEDQRLLIPMRQVQTFLTSPLARRMKDSDSRKLLYKEKPFMMGIQPEEAGIETDSQEMILVQGIIDVFFQEEGGWILADYKTDHVQDEEELIKRYQKQMELYASAIEKEKGKKVKEILIYSLHLGKEILIQSHQE